MDPLCESWWCDLPGPDETLTPYSNAPFAKARVRCLRVCAGAEPGSCLRGRPISLALTVARVRPSPYRRSGIRVRVFRSPPPRGGGRPLPALWGRGYRFAAALAAWIALRSVRNSGYLIQFCSRLVHSTAFVATPVRTPRPRRRVNANLDYSRAPPLEAARSAARGIRAHTRTPATAAASCGTCRSSRRTRGASGRRSYLFVFLLLGVGAAARMEDACASSPARRRRRSTMHVTPGACSNH